MTEHNKLHAFLSLAWCDIAIEFLFKLTARISEVLLAAGLIVSAADFLTDGQTLGVASTMSTAWAWTQAIAIESSCGVVFLSGIQSLKAADYVKASLYGVLGILLGIVAGVLLYIQLVAHSLGIAEANAIIKVGVNPYMLAFLRALSCVGYLLLSRTKHITFSNFARQQSPEPSHQTAGTHDPTLLMETLTPHLTVLVISLFEQQQTILIERLSEKLSLLPGSGTATAEPIIVATDTDQRDTTQHTELAEPGGTPLEEPTVDTSGQPEPEPKPLLRLTTGSTESRLHNAYQELLKEGGKVTSETLAKKAGIRKQTACLWLKNTETQEEKQEVAC